MSEIMHERPGVYSSYDASAVISAGRAAKVIGVAAKAAKGTAGEAVTLTGYAAGVAAFGEDGADTPGMSTILRLLFANGAATVTAVRVAEAGAVKDYQDAFAALGQQAVSVAKHFHDALGITGVVLTKLDGDARGGAALSIRKVTGCPIKFVGVGEKTEDLQVFHPDRMASRILGMGDIVSLVEKAAEEIDREEAEKLQEKLKKSQFDFNDFLGQLRQMSKMGGVEAILKMLPGGGKIAGIPGFEPEQFRRMEAMICSMNKKERENPDLIDMSRRRRIARGSGTTVEQVSQLIKQFTNMRKMMKNVGLFGHSFRGGRLGSMDMGALAAGGRMPSFSRGSNYTPPKKKRKKR